MAQAPSSTHPPASRENTPSRDVALLLGGQNPISLEYQIYPPSTSIDTLVTGVAADTAMDPCTYRVRGGALVQAHGCWGAEGKLGDSETDSMMEARGNLEI